MDDGRVMFTRWDYGVDKGVFQRHGVWTMNPDGSRLQFFFGNTVLDPNAFWQCVPVPGRPEVRLDVRRPSRRALWRGGPALEPAGLEAPRGEGFRFLTPEYPTYFDGDFWNGYMDPHPLNEHEFLVSYGGDGGQKNRLYLLDSRGNQTCIWEEAGELGCYNPARAAAARASAGDSAVTATPPEFGYVDPVVAGHLPGRFAARGPSSCTMSTRGSRGTCGAARSSPCRSWNWCPRPGRTPAAMPGTSRPRSAAARSTSAG